MPVKTLKFSHNVLVAGEHRAAGSVHDIEVDDAAKLIAYGFAEETEAKISRKKSAVDDPAAKKAAEEAAVKAAEEAAAKESAAAGADA